ncbi:MAG: hypothetical protein QHJ81_09590 [Anaerolineae bacterium]|nr:hypothetical protein [Anaerolineae bacterium]
MKQRETVSPSAIPLALAQLIERLTPEEKQEFALALNWQELRKLRMEAISQREGRRVGDPRIYVGTTASGLSLELPLRCVAPFISLLSHTLSAKQADILIQDSQGSEEHHCAADELEDWLANHPDAWQEKAMMIELGPHTLISGGGGCLSLALEDVPPTMVKEIAQGALKLCGYSHEFQKERFSALVWEDKLEVRE